MRNALILALGLAAVMVFATSAAAHRGAFFGRGFGAPVHSVFAVPHSHAVFGVGTPVRSFVVRPRRQVFFSFGFGAPVRPLFAVPPARVAPRVIVTPFPRVSRPLIVTAPPAGFVPQAVMVITPRRL
jgi:hypothetical protein